MAVEGKEASKLEAMSDRSGNIDRMDFIVYAKKSAIFKTLLTDGEGQQSQDKAEIAFKVCKNELKTENTVHIMLCGLTIGSILVTALY